MECGVTFFECISEGVESFHRGYCFFEDTKRISQINKLFSTRNLGKKGLKLRYICSCFKN